MHFDSQPHGPLFLIRRRSLVFNIWEHLGISKNTYDTVVHKCHHNFSNSVCIIVLALFCIFYLTPWLCTYSSFNFVFRFYILFLLQSSSILLLLLGTIWALSVEIHWSNFPFPIKNIILILLWFSPQLNSRCLLL